MNHVFKGRSLNVIEDFTIEERRYFFRKVKELKCAIVQGDTAKQEEFRINDPDFGIYSVFLENSTRTKESFKNAAKFHHVKVSELLTGGSSINKGESYCDTFNTVSGYQNNIFIVRSTVEGLTKWLSEETAMYTKRNGLPCTPAFINAGDGKHEHPTQELLDEFTFLEDNDMSFDALHVALVGDLYHGRTIHSKVDGLKLFHHVKVDLIAPEELQLQESYVEKMRQNGFAVRLFPSIEEYLQQEDISRQWYFTRPQLERMGERILQKQDSLRQSITFRREFIPKLPENTKFYHPLPRHKEHPTIPTWLDSTPLNGWERQSINGYYCRIVLIGLIAGAIGEDFIPTAPKTSAEEEDYICEVTERKTKTQSEYSEGIRPIYNGLVIDHICKGETPREIREHMNLISRVMGLDDGRGGQWISCGSDGQYKGLLFRPDAPSLSRTDLKRLASVAPGSTLNIIKEGAVAEKYRAKIPPRIYDFDDLCCKNESCITHPVHAEMVPAKFYRTADGQFACAYCGRVHTFKEIWKK